MTNGSKRTILIVVCAIFMVVCLLALPWFCSTDSKKPEPIPAPLLPIPAPNEPGSSTGEVVGGSGSCVEGEGKDSFGNDPSSRNPNEDVKTPQVGCGTSNPGGSNHQSHEAPIYSPEPIPVPTPHHSSNTGQGKLAISISTLVILLLSYIVARVRSKQGVLVMTANVYDKILILLSPILFFVVWCIGFEHDLSAIQIILLSISCLMLFGSFFFSISSNHGNWLNITISILSKLFIFVFTNILLLLLIVIIVFSFMRALSRHSDREGTYVVKYDHFLDQWVGYRID